MALNYIGNAGEQYLYREKTSKLEVKNEWLGTRRLFVDFDFGSRSIRMIEAAIDDHYN